MTTQVEFHMCLRPQSFTVLKGGADTVQVYVPTGKILLGLQAGKQIFDLFGFFRRSLVK